MVTCQHIFEERIYLISCKSVEGLEIFAKGSEKRKIRRTIEHYLRDFCRIIHLQIRRSEFHMLLQMGSRKNFKDFYEEKYKGKVKEPFFIPPCAYIFGRQMSNLLVSFVKSYNWKYERKGVLMDGRYRRKLIESEKELNAMILLLKSGDYCIGNPETGKKRNRKRENTKADRGHRKDFVLEEIKSESKSQLDRRGCFKAPYKTSLIPPFLAQKMKIFKANYPCGPNYN